MNVDLIKTFQFEAAHLSPRSEQGADEVHGHSYVVEIIVSGTCDPDLGWLIDYADISRIFDPLYDQLDHRYLNDVKGMDDVSLPGVRQWIRQQLAPELPVLKDVQVFVVGDGAFRPMRQKADPRYGTPERLRFTFEAAHYLPNLPETHKCRRMHGHSFQVEAAARDLEALKPRLAECYSVVDRHCLNDLPGLHNATSEQLAHWLWDRLSRHVTDLTTLIVAETCTARCVYHGE
jgi:6-pyruvoyltetrahydropterin/6-carboxytetrahydropterin synthase